MSKSELFKLMAFNSLLSQSYGYSFEEIYYMSNDDVRNISVSLILEIRELFEKGYSFEKVKELIDSCDFNEYNLDDDQIDFLKRDANKTLKIVYRKGEKNGKDK